MRTVSQLLQNKTNSFNTVNQDLLVIEALNQLSSLNISYLVVMEDEAYKGIFSEKDYCRNVTLKGLSSNNTTVKDVMTSDFPVVFLEDSIEHCLNTMNSFKTRYLLVFDEQRFIGVITIHDLLRQVITNKEQVFDVTLTHNLIEADEKCPVY